MAGLDFGFDCRICLGNCTAYFARSDFCGWVYDPEIGDPDSGIAPGTPFEDIPDDWECPDCGVTKEDFSVMD